MDTTLFKAIRNSNLAEARTALDAGANVNATDGSGKTPILIATELGNIEMAGLLLDHKADPNLQDNRRENAYSTSATNGNLALLKLIFEKSTVKINVNATNRYGGIPLIPASERGHVEIVRFLLTKGVNINHVNHLGWTALLEVVILGKDTAPWQEITKLLLENKADIEIKDPNGKTALDIARDRGFRNIAGLLEAYKA